MKIKLLYFTILIILGCKNETSLETKPDWIQSSSENIIFLNTDKNSYFSETDMYDTLQVLVKIKHVLSIGWGTLYKCQVLEIYKGVLTGIDSIFKMSASVGSENIYKD